MNTEETNLNTTDETTPEVVDAPVTMADEAADTASASDIVTPTAAPIAPVSASQDGPRQFGGRGGRGGNDRGGRPGGRGGSGRGGPRREARSKPEFDQKIIDIRRVTRVAAGGRRFSFSVALVAGDRKGRIGVGTGKGGDTALAVEKAFRSAKKNMIVLNLTKTGSIAHEVSAKYSSARVEIMPAPGKGIAAGSSVRDVIELAGVKDVIAKLRSGTKNKLNNAQVTLKALAMVKKPRVRSTPAATVTPTA